MLLGHDAAVSSINTSIGTTSTTQHDERRQRLERTSQEQPAEQVVVSSDPTT